MKKKLLILAMCLFSTLSANAATWVAIDSGNPEIQMFIDSDSINYISVDTCTYALLYKKGDEHTQVIYVKSDYSKDQIGIVEMLDFEPNKYNPGFYSKHSRAFMKGISSNSILKNAHNFALSMYHEKINDTSENTMDITNIKHGEDYLPANSRFGFTDEEYNTYINGIKSKILSNWLTTIGTVYTDVSLIISVNADGSYNGYRILESSDNEKAIRSAIAAVNLAAPFAPFPTSNVSTQTLNIPINFEQKFFRKYVK